MAIMSISWNRLNYPAFTIMSKEIAVAYILSIPTYSSLLLKPTNAGIQQLLQYYPATIWTLVV